jgi:hypothetical protein
MLKITETQRLALLYEQLRLKLLDLSKKNRMLNYSLGAKSKRSLQIIDEVLGVISHVEAMKDRIPVQVRVIRQGVGRSIVRIVAPQDWAA